MISLKSIQDLQIAVRNSSGTSFAVRGKMLIDAAMRVITEDADLSMVDARLRDEINTMAETMVRSYDFDSMREYLSRYEEQMRILADNHALGIRLASRESNPHLPLNFISPQEPNLQSLQRMLEVANELDDIYSAARIMGVDYRNIDLIGYGVPKIHHLHDIINDVNNPDHEWYETLSKETRLAGARDAGAVIKKEFKEKLENIRKEVFELTFPKTKQGENLREQITGMISNLMDAYK